MVDHAQINMACLAPLAVKVIGNSLAESLVKEVTVGRFDVSSLLHAVSYCVANGFPLNITSPAVHIPNRGNYDSALNHSDKVSDAIAKRLSKGYTKGPFNVSDDQLKTLGVTINPLGAVPKKNDPSVMRPVDDALINCFCTAFHFAMPAVQHIRAQSFIDCLYSVVDVEDAFASLNFAKHERRHMCFRWFDLINDPHCMGSDQACVYVHLSGNFGPRNLPFWYTMVQLLVNVSSLALQSPLQSPPIAFIDDNTLISASIEQLTVDTNIYHVHLELAGLPEKLKKRKFPFHSSDHSEEILGRWFDSTPLTMAVTVDKLDRLGIMFMIASLPGAKLQFKQLRSFVGLWIFCAETLPNFVSTFFFNTFAWFKRMQHIYDASSHSVTQYVPRNCKSDFDSMLYVLVHFNGSALMQPLAGKPILGAFYIDACKSNAYAGCGYCSRELYYERKFTARERKASINVLEMKTLHDLVSHQGSSWSGHIVPVYMDNESDVKAYYKRRSTNRSINLMLQDIFIASCTFHFHINLIWIPRDLNVLADALSKDMISFFWSSLPSFVWLDTGSTSSTSPLKVLPLRVQGAVLDYKSKAYKETSDATWASGWKCWMEYCTECQVSPYSILDSDELEIYLAGFKAMLAKGAYGRGKHKSYNTTNTYISAVMKAKESRHNLLHDVDRGIKVVHGTRERLQDPLTLEHLCTLAEFADHLSLRDVRNVVIYLFLGLGVQRSQSAVIKSTSNWHDKQDLILMVDNVSIDYTKYAVRFAIHWNKTDAFGERRDEHGYDYVWCAGKKDQPMVDIVAWVTRYAKLMRFDRLSKHQAESTPFFQTVRFDKPTGTPLTYSTVLRDFRHDLIRIQSRFPNLRPDRLSLHSFRRLGATLAKIKGIPNDLIMFLGRWKSDTFMTYFMFDDDEQIAINSKLLG